MFPIKDTAPRRTFPFVNYILIAVNVAVFVYELVSPDFERLILTYGFTPQNFDIFNLSTYVPVFTSMFLHGSFFHIISNMWFLYIFGDNVEDRIGHFPYLLFYLAAGFFASMAQYVLSIQSAIPQIGASGAISGVIGSYFIFFRKEAVQTLIIFFFIWDIVEVPVWFFLGFWFVIQLFSGVGMIVANTFDQGGVAFFAHIGGFVFGLLAGLIINRGVKIPKK
jgi:membrane associated rhomboid family serine protease